MGSLFEILMYVLAVLCGLAVPIVVFLIISPFLKERLKQDPDEPDKIGMFVQVGTGREVAIDFGGNYYYRIDGDSGRPVTSSAFFGLWKLYKEYVWKMTQLHVYVPFFTEPKTYDLPRYRVVEKGGKKDYVPVEQGSKGYRSNHIRTAPFTWHFEFAGAEIQTVPFTIKGSCQVLIKRDRIEEALYKTESWNVLLDQALNSVTRAVVRGGITIDMVLGSIKKSIWDDEEADAEELIKDALYQVVAKAIFTRVLEYHFENADGGDFADATLASLGIIILRIDITDFEDEMTDAERVDLRSAVIGRQKGRARDLVGQGIAQEQKHMLEVLENHDLAEAILSNRALVDAAKEGKLDALLAALISKFK